MKLYLRRAAAVAAALTIVGLGVVAAGCGEPAEADPTPVKTWKITPAPPGSGATATPAPTEAPSDGTPPAGTPSGEGTLLEVAAVGTLFDVTELSAPAGPITIEFDNRDGGVVHNFAVYPGDDASQDPIGATELEPGPIVQTLELDLEAGEYFYQCDSHPATMAGTLDVS